MAVCSEKTCDPDVKTLAVQKNQRGASMPSSDKEVLALNLRSTADNDPGALSQINNTATNTQKSKAQSGKDAPNNTALAQVEVGIFLDEMRSVFKRDIDSMYWLKRISAVQLTDKNGTKHDCLRIPSKDGDRYPDIYLFNSVAALKNFAGSSQGGYSFNNNESKILLTSYQAFVADIGSSSPYLPRVGYSKVLDHELNHSEGMLEILNIHKGWQRVAESQGRTSLSQEDTLRLSLIGSRLSNYYTGIFEIFAKSKDPQKISSWLSGKDLENAISYAAIYAKNSNISTDSKPLSQIKQFTDKEKSTIIWFCAAEYFLNEEYLSKSKSTGIPINKLYRESYAADWNSILKGQGDAYKRIADVIEKFSQKNNLGLINPHSGK